MPVILAFAVTGAYAGNYLRFDCFLLVGFSVLGYLMKRNDFPAMPLILGLLLGGTADVELLRINQLFDSFWGIFKSPIVLVLAAASLASVLLPFFMKEAKRRKPVK